jgi:hypothetical protein
MVIAPDGHSLARVQAVRMDTVRTDTADGGAPVSTPSRVGLKAAQRPSAHEDDSDQLMQLGRWENEGGAVREAAARPS